MIKAERTMAEWLEDLANRLNSNEEDYTTMVNLLRTIGFPLAVVTLGIVYLEGRGESASIHQVASMLLRLA